MKKTISIFVGVLIAGGGIWIGYDLLIAGKLEGGHFVALLLGFVVVGIVIPYLPDISELSIAGNVVKFRRITEEAEKTLQQLDESRIATFRTLIRLAVLHGGWFRSDEVTKDERFDNFMELVHAIKANGLQNILSQELLETAKMIRKGQFHVIGNFTSIELPSDGNVPNYKEVRSLALDSLPNTQKQKKG